MEIQSYEYVDCREIGHRWSPGGFDSRPRRAGIARVFKCDRCSAERHDIYNTFGGVIEQRYKYPAGYQVKGGGLKRADFRREAMVRAGVVSARRSRRLKAV